MHGRLSRCCAGAVIFATALGCSIDPTGIGDTPPTVVDSALADTAAPETIAIDTDPVEIDSTANDTTPDVTDVAIDTGVDVPVTGSLAVTAEPLSSGAVIDLTAEGTTGWAHWGLVDRNSFTHRAGVSATLLGDGPVASTGRYDGYFVGFTWTDGDPIAAVTNSTTGVYRYVTGDVLQFSAAATTSLQTLRVYLSTDKGTAAITFSLSDGSAAPAVQALPVSGTPAGPGHRPQMVQLVYRAATSGARLLVKLEKTDDAGSVSLHAATLK